MSETFHPYKHFHKYKQLHPVLSCSLKLINIHAIMNIEALWHSLCNSFSVDNYVLLHNLVRVTFKHVLDMWVSNLRSE